MILYMGMGRDSIEGLNTFQAKTTFFWGGIGEEVRKSTARGVTLSHEGNRNMVKATLRCDI